MKSILFKIQQFPHLSETFIINQINMAIESGYEVSILVKNILSFEDCGHLEMLNKHNVSNRIIKDDYKIPKNKLIRLFKAILIILKYRRKWKKFYEYIKLKSTFSLTWIYEVNFYQKLRNFDIIHVQYGTNVQPVDLLKKTGWLDLRIIVSFHGHDAFFPINGIIPQKGYYDHLFSEKIILIANTPYLAQQLIKIGAKPESIKIIPVPVDTEIFKGDRSNMKDKLPIKLLSIGRLEKIKGHEYGIHAVNNLIKSNYDIKYTIIGEGSYRNSIEELIKSEGLNDKVLLLGKKNQHEILREIQISDICLATSVTTNNQIKETQGLAGLEAQACGVPVVAFDSGGVKYTLIHKKTGLLSEEKDIDKFAENIKYLINNFQKRMEYGKNAQEFVQKKYSNIQIAKQWLAVYN